MTPAIIETISTPFQEIDGLAALLQDAVAGGASIGFLHDLTKNEAVDYWRKVIADVGAGTRLLWVARDPTDRSIIGSVQMGLESRRNGRHRAEVQKLMVLRAWRRQGIARELLQTLEQTAQRRQIALLFLDTSDGAGGARDFYEAMDYHYVGGIPDYALDPDGAPAKNAIYCKQLIHKSGSPK